MTAKNVGIIVAAALAMYVWGMIYWGLSPLPYLTWHQTRDDVAAGQALREHFPEQGTYYLPGEHHGPEAKAELYDKGPIAFVHVTAPDGRPVHEPWVLVKGLVLCLSVAFLLAMVFRIGDIQAVGARLRVGLLAGAAATIMIDGGDMVWWYLPWDWKMAQAVYNLSAWFLTSLVLAYGFKAPQT
ncbi:hypothetical protein SCOR_07780 [Sulfidibacter corallicola]|uniref:Uncharacterized protein n=1 Tax=Sulfidibacter corallicola TaxID=2818388 RepID=A0A8A4TPH6_SULCO|nr:hypothetical protein [Sulfidibacter corallicola]QTD51337.1 hypothetical protein J3U87_02615 [Sulfidibacter corallicola]